MEEEDEIQAQACKFPRLGNGRNEPNKLGSSRGNEAEDGELRKRVGSDGSTNRFHSTSTWHQSSRIVRVSRASGGKDRHSKVMTSKGLRDRRVRLSVTTAIQFYDLQDRLGYDQPSKAVEWLIKAASDAISELPSLNYTSFPDTPKQPSDEKRPISTLVTDHQQGFDDVDGDNTNNNYHYQNQNQNQSQSQNFSLSKSACSSTSETSKGSGLSLSRSEIRVKARERARERAAKEKEKENEAHIARHQHHHQNVNPMSQTASFTELLTGGIGSTTVSLPTTTTTTTTTTSPNGSVHQIHGGDEHNLFNKAAATTTTRQSQQWSSTVTPMVMDYFSSGLVMGPSSSRTHQTSSSTGFSGQIQLGNNSLPVSVSPFGAAENHSDQLQHFSFIPDHLIPAASGSDCNLNFTISPSLAGYNRGTLQSNSPSHQILPHHLQRFSSPIDGSNNLPFFMGGGASAAPTMDTTNHHQLQFTPVLDGRLQLCYGDGTRHSDQKGKAKN